MNPFAAGLREFLRKFDRQRLNFRLPGLRRNLSQAETQLGLLGWQQADFPPDLQREVDQINNLEREQARLMNAQAEAAVTLQKLASEQLVLNTRFLRDAEVLELKKQAVLRERAAMEEKLAAWKKDEPACVARMAEVEKEIVEVQKAYNALLGVEHHTPQSREDMVRLRERSVALPNERSDLRIHQQRMANQSRTLGNELLANAEKLAEIEASITSLRAQFQEADGALDQQTKKLQTERARMDKESETLEKAKGNPYLQIGRCLADFKMAPANQPEALVLVQQLRQEVLDTETLVANSLAESAQEDPVALRNSYLAFAAVLGLVLLVWWL